MSQHFATTFITKHKVCPGAHGDRVVTCTRNDTVGTILKLDRIISAMAQIDRFDQLQIAVRKERRLAVVAQNRILASSRLNLIITRSADDRVCAVGQCDSVSGSGCEVSAFNRQQGSAITQQHRTIVAQHDAASIRGGSVDADRVRGRSTDDHVIA